MTRRSALLLSFVAMTVAVSAQQPIVQNGRMETRQATSIDREVSSFTASADPVWIGWRVPIVDGEGGGCSGYFSGENELFWRGTQLDYGLYGNSTVASRPTAPAAASAIQIEASSNLFVLARVTDGRVDRLQRTGGDCPIDAGGRALYWLTGITPTESLRWLEGFIGMEKGDRLSLTARRSLATSAIGAIAVHRDAGADPILDRLAMNERDQTVRSQAETALGRYRGAHGFSTLRALLAQERAPDVRVRLVTAIGQTRETGTVDALRGLLKDTEPRVRSEAVYYFALRGGPSVVPEIRAVMGSDSMQEVRTRAVSGLARMPEDTSVPVLIDIVNTSKDLEVRKASVSALGRCKDPRATTFLVNLLSR